MPPGTLTTNQMSVVQLSQMDTANTVKTWTVKGHTYNPDEGVVVALPKLCAALAAAAEVGCPPMHACVHA